MPDESDEGENSGEKRERETGDETPSPDAEPDRQSLPPGAEMVPVPGGDMGTPRRVLAAEQLNLPMPGAMMMATFQKQELRGPLPSPAMLADFERAVPGTAKTIIRWAEEEANHRRDMDRREFSLIETTLTTQTEYQGRGMRYGLIVALAGFLLTGFLAYIREPLVAGIVGALDLVALVGVFVYGRKTQAEMKKTQLPPMMIRPPELPPKGKRSSERKSLPPKKKK